jgi:hypothetical protein
MGVGDWTANGDDCTLEELSRSGIQPSRMIHPQQVQRDHTKKAEQFEEKEKERVDKEEEEQRGRRRTFANLHNMFNPSIQLYIRS